MHNHENHLHVCTDHLEVKVCCCTDLTECCTQTLVGCCDGKWECCCSDKKYEQVGLYLGNNFVLTGCCKHA